MAQRTAFLFGPPVEHLQSGSHWLSAVDEQHEFSVGSEHPQQQLDDWQHCEELIALQQPQAVSQQQVANTQEGDAINKQAIAIKM